MSARKYHTHPLSALFQAAGWADREGMKWIADRGGFISDLWEWLPKPEEIPTGEQIAIFEAAKVRFNHAFCDRWISAIRERA